MIIPRGLSFDLEVARAQMPPGVTSEGWATYHGPAIMYFYTENPQAQFPYKSWWLNYHTPIDSEQLDLASSVIVAPYGDNTLPEEFLDMYPQMAHAAFWQDVVIWQTKIYRSDPILCDGDGSINKLRKWYEQFYLPKGS
jgi:3-ketosteroid 9alpha-monooxygenase subunit A